MRQRHSCISHGSNVEHNALRSWHATMYEFVTSMVLCGLGMQQCAMYNATIQKTTFCELGVPPVQDYVFQLRTWLECRSHRFLWQPASQVDYKPQGSTIRELVSLNRVLLPT